ncbi:hypothetical protein ACFQZQ_10510 [Lysobacter koreensis]|uniref:Uncharacterized protein n=1 Tax=Lysobacter koreensis TaxID=266122 RepID=A0ABW2YNU2_9GAMM
MTIGADELLTELARADASLALAVRRAGQGCEPEFERRLDGHARSLRALLDGNGAEVATDTVEAAKRVLDAADPAAPLLMLAMARETLTALVRRQAARLTQQAA